MEDYKMVTVSNTYECEICFRVNHFRRLNCSCCGTIPSFYSFKGKPIHYAERLDSFVALDVVQARGAEHVEHHHTRRVYFRTVPADYYAD